MVYRYTSVKYRKNKVKAEIMKFKNKKSNRLNYYNENLSVFKKISKFLIKKREIQHVGII